MSDLVRNPEDMFASDATQFKTLALHSLTDIDGKNAWILNLKAFEIVDDRRTTVYTISSHMSFGLR